ncbi:MAG: hypothetical protein KF884_05085 [Fimbriimonadaceae bacterium]|nr:hypothetical protein [Fimbriimonadaceae bacterium]QYK59459.1 MAG: hypothetical protein KF884_05085 [Fimbriimonadaceae bacterium]
MKGEGMDKRELIKKLVREEPLRVDESLWLDEALDSQGPVREWVGQAAADEPSLAWRSRLNQRLAASVPKPRHWRRRPWAPAIGFAGVAAGALFLATMNPIGKPSAAPELDSTSFEHKLVKAHHEAGLGENGRHWVPAEFEPVPDL